MSRIFTAQLRERARAKEATIYGTVPDLTLAYIEALEDVARAAELYIKNSTPTNAVMLDAALDAVDRMQV